MTFSYCAVVAWVRQRDTSVTIFLPWIVPFPILRTLSNHFLPKDFLYVFLIAIVSFLTDPVCMTVSGYTFDLKIYVHLHSHFYITF